MFKKGFRKPRKYNWLPSPWGVGLAAVAAAGGVAMAQQVQFQITRAAQTLNPVSISEYTIFRIVGEILLQETQTAAPNGVAGQVGLGLYLGVDGPAPVLDPLNVAADAEFDGWIWLFHDIYATQVATNFAQTNPRLRIPLDIKRRVKLKAGMNVVLGLAVENMAVTSFSYLRALITNID